MRNKPLIIILLLATLFTSCSNDGLNLTVRIRHDRSFACVPPELALLSRVSEEATSMPYIPPVCSVDEVYVSSGEWVYRGEVVARLSSPFIDRALDVQQSRVEAEKARLEKLEDSKERLESFPMAVALVDEVESAIKVQKQVVRLNQELLASLKAVRDCLTIKSRTAGLVIDTAEEGEVVVAGQPVVVLEQAAGKIYAYVPESQVSKVGRPTLDIPQVGRVEFALKPELSYISGEYVFDDFRALKGAEIFRRVPSLPFKNSEIFDLCIRKEDVR